MRFGVWANKDLMSRLGIGSCVLASVKMSGGRGLARPEPSGETVGFACSKGTIIIIFC